MQARARRGARLPARGRGPAPVRRRSSRDDPDIVVPEVVAHGDTVLVTEWMESPYSLARIIREGTQEERDHYGELLVRFLFSGPIRTGMLHADPHPGNFRILPGPDGGPGRLASSTSARSPGSPSSTLPEAMGRLIRLARARGQGGAARGTARRGLRQGQDPARPRPAAGLPLALRRADQGRAVPVHAGSGCAPSSRGSTTPASPTYTIAMKLNLPPDVPPDPPHLARRDRRAQPARGRGAVPGDPRGVPARVRRRRLRPAAHSGRYITCRPT